MICGVGTGRRCCCERERDNKHRRVRQVCAASYASLGELGKTSSILRLKGQSRRQPPGATAVVQHLSKPRDNTSAGEQPSRGMLASFTGGQPMQSVTCSAVRVYDRLRSGATPICGS